MLERFSLDAASYVVELASNDGYLLQYFVAKGIPVLGVEPAANVAESVLLALDGIVTVEVPHLMRLIDEKQFDTIYHEHFAYFSF